MWVLNMGPQANAASTALPDSSPSEWRTGSLEVLCSIKGTAHLNLIGGTPESLTEPGTLFKPERDTRSCLCNWMNLCLVATLHPALLPDS